MKQREYLVHFLIVILDLDRPAEVIVKLIRKKRLGHLPENPLPVIRDQVSILDLQEK